MSLVVLSLVASAIIATIAFVVAGKSATLSIELDSALKIDSKLNDVFSNNPEYFESSDFRYFFFSSSYAAGHDYYLVNMNGDLVNYTSQENRNISTSDTFEILTNINTFKFNNITDWITISPIISNITSLMQSTSPACRLPSMVITIISTHLNISTDIMS
jgi:hypothetical protein